MVALPVGLEEAQQLTTRLMAEFGQGLQAPIGETFFATPSKQTTLTKIARGLRAVLEGLRQGDFSAEFGTAVLGGMEAVATDFIADIHHATTGGQSTYEERNAAWVESGKPETQFDDDIPF